MMKHTLPTALSAILLAACQTLPAAAPDTMNTRHWATLVKQDANLYRIDDRLYRSEQPVAEDGATLSRLGIRSVVNLRFFDRNDDDHLKTHGLTLINRPLLSWNIKPKDIAEILYLIEKQQQNGPVLIHCYHGADRTGLIAGMYRILYQGWTVEDAKAEMQHGPYGYHSIWKNIANLFTEEKVQEVKTHLNRLRRNGQDTVSKP